jgi:MYXO-CTERM domain-containing protein
MLKKALVLVTAVVAGCSTADAPVEARGSSHELIVNGTTSSTAQDSVVFLMKGQDESCSGTLIAPNLVLTARHCVATPPETTECGGYTNTTTASNMSIKLGVSSNWDVGSVVARGKKIFEPTKNDMCGFDVALILLDRDVPNAKISKVRFTPLKNGEKTIAVGYGADENDNTLPRRMQRETTILGVGPAKIAYKSQDGQTFNYDAPTGDVVTGESTCFGDSGGPLFDVAGNVVAMTSRGPVDSPMGGVHGSNGCADMVSIYASTILNKDLIMSAAQQAGHPILDDSAAPKTTTPAPTDNGDDDSSLGDDDDDVGSASGDDDDDDTSERKPKTKTTKKKSSGAAQSTGCSTSHVPGGTSHGALMVFGLALAACLRRRVRSR